MENKLIREQQITRTSLIGIAANLLLAGFKAAVGLLAGSIAIVLDAVNNLTDALSSVITILGVKLAKRRPDEKHPFGYGRIEYLSAVIISAIVLSAGATSFFESVKDILHPTTPKHSAASLVIIGVAVAVKLLLGRYVKAQGEKYNSEALVASGSDASFDAVISASTLVGALITMLFHISIDGYLGALISVFILKAGIEMLLDSFNDIMGKRPDSAITKQIRACAGAVPGVLGAYDLILHNYGPNSAIGSIHVEVPDTMDARSLNTVTRTIQTAVLEQFHVFLTVGFYVIDTSRQADIERINAIATAHPGALGTHGVSFDDERRRLSFDVLLDFTVHDKPGLCEALRSELAPVFPGYDVTINFDTDYSD